MSEPRDRSGSRTARRSDRRSGRARGAALTDALGLAAQVRDGQVSPGELAEQAIARIEATNPTLNFLVTEAFDFAEPADGPFRGVPMLVKDLTETAGIRTTFSSRTYADYVPQTDAGTVRRMREAGFTIVGKSNTPEFGITCVTESDLNGACLNPWDTSRTPGGSSGGAAAAVAAGVLPLAHGSDGGGSIRIPASCCGLFGLKPSRGRVSPAPYVSGSLEMSQQAGVSVTVRDAAAFLDVLAGYEPGDAHGRRRPSARSSRRSCSRRHVERDRSPPGHVRRVARRSKRAGPVTGCCCRAPRCNLRRLRPRRPSSATSSSTAAGYLVQPGDTLSAIAAREGTTVDRARGRERAGPQRHPALGLDAEPVQARAPGSRAGQPRWSNPAPASSTERRTRRRRW